MIRECVVPEYKSWGTVGFPPKVGGGCAFGETNCWVVILASNRETFVARWLIRGDIGYRAWACVLEMSYVVLFKMILVNEVAAITNGMGFGGVVSLSLRVVLFPESMLMPGIELFEEVGSML